MCHGDADNDSGQIADYGIINGQTHAFLLTPLGPGSGASIAASARSSPSLATEAIAGSGPATSGPISAPAKPAAGIEASAAF